MSGLTEVNAFNEKFKICYTGSDAIEWDDCVMGTGFWPVLSSAQAVNKSPVVFICIRAFNDL